MAGTFCNQNRSAICDLAAETEAAGRGRPSEAAVTGGVFSLECRLLWGGISSDDGKPTARNAVGDGKRRNRGLTEASAGAGDGGSRGEGEKAGGGFVRGMMLEGGPGRRRGQLAAEAMGRWEWRRNV